MSVLERYDLIIFDLDGTLYEGGEHFEYYANHLKQKVKEDQQKEFASDYEKMKEGEHPVTIGKAYDVEKDLVLTIDPMTLLVAEALRWDGSLLSEQETRDLYQEKLIFDFESMIAIGDGWWLPFVCAKHYGVEDCYSSYVATKEFMVTDAFTLDPLPGLKDSLERLAAATSVVLVTNSDIDDVNRLLHELQLTDMFKEVIPSAKKPAETSRLFKQLLAAYQVEPDRTVSIGDNYINDVAPAVLLGMDGIYINPDTPPSFHRNVKVISSVVDCFH
ncbi:HAD family hydrolase [Alkalihalophilus marmarensis]|jgi:putative hydrolase of the HAD superfamily|uniref:HAD family hydrolase n=1 Tax=Alkalihalophilus marmarensis TaxID=521377 RepID=UPI00059D470B|nr:HAD family hydrolase [Alkalihalophilus marmarensis]MCM3488009.1 HAD family hydrolase [Alkalihalophilus marmarensis]